MRDYGLCIATPDDPHPAETRTGRCRFHQAQYDKANRRYNQALRRYNATGHEDSNPGPKDQWLAEHLIYTPVTAPWTLIAPEERRHLRDLLLAQTAALGPLHQLLTQSGYADLTVRDMITMVRTALDSASALSDLLEPLTREPEPGRVRPPSAEVPVPAKKTARKRPAKKTAAKKATPAKKTAARKTAAPRR